MVSKREKPDKDSQAAPVKKRASVKSASKNREKLHDDLGNKKSGGKLDPGLYCFMAIAQFHGIPADPEQIAHALAIDPRVGMSETDMLRAARSMIIWIYGSPSRGHSNGMNWSSRGAVQTP